jgi:hypothetical protein
MAGESDLKSLASQTEQRGLRISKAGSRASPSLNDEMLLRRSTGNDQESAAGKKSKDNSPGERMEGACCV